MLTQQEAGPGSLARRVAALGRVVVAAVAATALLAATVLLLLVSVLVPASDRAIEGGRAMRLGHLAMLDQETGLRAYLATGQGALLAPYTAGALALPGRNAEVRAAFAGDPQELRLYDEVVRRQQVWQLAWAVPALGGVPKRTTAAAFVDRGKELFDAYRAAEQTAELRADALRVRAQARQVQVITAGLLLEVLLLAGVGLLLRRRFAQLRDGVVTPVQELLATIGRLRDGQLDARAPRDGPDELRQIGQGLDELAEALDTERDLAGQRELLLVRARREAESANEAKSSFLATMSHEIRTPMNAVIGLTGLLLDTSLDDEQRGFVETVRGSGEALLAIINDILDYSKIESGQLELERQPFSVRDCVEASLDLVGPQAAAKGLDLAYELAENVPAVAEGDLTRLRQVLVNLLGNAVKFTATGEVLVRVAVESEDDRGVHLAFSVSDTGIGIPAERIGLLFRSFSQVDASTTRTYGGTGLGLAISRRLAEAMGGRLDVRSTPGVGSTFTLHAPLPRGAATPDRLRQVAAELAGRAALVVDDNDTNRRILRHQLQGWGMRVEDEADPLAALARFRAGAAYDVVVLDMHMPGMDGLTLAGALRDTDSGRDVPLVLLTSLGQRPRQAAGPGLVHLTKPVKAAVLQRSLARALGAHDQEQASVLACGPLPCLRVLLAEDNAVNQKVATLMLERLGQRPDVVGNGLDAVRALHAARYDVVLMDVQMPVLDGLEATRRIRAELPPGRQPRIVAMTANALVEDREACCAAGMDDHLAKPVRASELADALRQAVPGAGRGAPAQRAAEQPAGATDGPAAVDPTVLQALTARLGARGPALRESLVQTWQDETGRRLVELTEAVAARDAAGVARVAHTMKSGSASLGALRLAEVCEQAEQLLRLAPVQARDLPAVADGIRAEAGRASRAFALQLVGRAAAALS